MSFDLVGFYEGLNAFFERELDRPHLEFCCAVLPKLDTLCAAPLTTSNALALVEVGLTGAVAPFDAAWLSYDCSPVNQIFSRKLTAISQTEPSLPTTSEEGAALFRDVLRFHAAEMTRMGDAANNPNSWFGIDSPTGHRWYNFRTLGLLECGTACSGDNDDDWTAANWGSLAQLLEDGRINE